MNQVLPGVGNLICEVQVEGTFPDGTKLVGVPSFTIGGWELKVLELVGLV